MKPDPDVVALSQSPGWQKLQAAISDFIKHNSNALSATDFQNLLEVGRFQGENRAFKRVLEWVEKRSKED